MQEEKILPAAQELLKDGGVDETFGTAGQLVNCGPGAEICLFWRLRPRGKRQ